MTRLATDVVVIGSGFGGSVAALRLVEKGYKVCVLEEGRRFADHEFPKTSYRVRSFLYAPKLGLNGILRISLLGKLMVLSGAGVGGGSLVYANTLYEPSRGFFRHKQWCGITDWQLELSRYFELARRMLGSTRYPYQSPADSVMQEVAEEMGVKETFSFTDVGVYFGNPAQLAEDPYFGGLGPSRRGCINCGECMTGCRHGAKNILTKNYLYLAEKAGARISSGLRATLIKKSPDGRFIVETERPGIVGLAGPDFVADQVVLAAGSLGTQKLLQRCKQQGTLPKLPDSLGKLLRSNSEAILGARTSSGRYDFSEGVAITSSFDPDPFTKIEPVRYGHGSNLLGLLGTALVDGGQGSRKVAWLAKVARHPAALVKGLYLKHWSEQTLIILVMQSEDNSLNCRLVRSAVGERLLVEQGEGEPNPVWIPVGHQVARAVAKKIRGVPAGGINDIFDIPMTAHLIGGAVIGDAPESGVVDAYHRVFGYEGLHIMDGSVIPANLGVNPSLTITAMAERAVSYWPNKGEPDLRPAVGSGYQAIEPVKPKRPLLNL
jgi:cholesterol oxidase